MEIDRELTWKAFEVTVRANLFAIKQFPKKTTNST